MIVEPLPITHLLTNLQLSIRASKGALCIEKLDRAEYGLTLVLLYVSWDSSDPLSVSNTAQPVYHQASV